MVIDAAARIICGPPGPVARTPIAEHSGEFQGANRDRAKTAADVGRALREQITRWTDALVVGVLDTLADARALHRNDDRERERGQAQFN